MRFVESPPSLVTVFSLMTVFVILMSQPPKCVSFALTEMAEEQPTQAVLIVHQQALLLIYQSIALPRDSLPSFAMEVSIRRRDVEGADADITDGGATDPKQLTRVFKGCKVKDFSMTADTDSQALRLSVNFDSAHCYTDTGRLETSAVANYSSGTKGDRYKTHRMFEETASTPVLRKEAGIEVGTQKPFMFYNGTVVIAGVNVGQVVSFTVTGNTGVQQFYTINGVIQATALLTKCRLVALVTLPLL